MNSNDIPSKERVKAILINWRLWAWDCPPDPAEVYYYTESPVFSGAMTIREVNDLGLRIIGLMDTPNDLYNPPPVAPVTTMTSEEYANAPL